MVLKQRDDILYQLKSGKKTLLQLSTNVFGSHAQPYAEHLKAMFDKGRRVDDLKRKKEEWKRSPNAD